ncbi:MAG: (2Fe-2S)-binding protein [Thermomicrobiales bacterium]|nr:(2Fe-2S)-binding protein [Thermomicrobiales bacterium]MCA9880295.1 (2Fe-2S)-binding protein [Thermomicrobiales bacterium]
MADENLGAPAGARRIASHPILGDLLPAGQVVFTFDGQEVSGREGETLLPALLASGVRVLRTMPDLGDPRGGYCLVGRCSDCQVVVDGVPSVRACTTAVRRGMDVRTQHGLGTDAWNVAGDDL